MKKTILFFLFAGTTTLLSSCFLFKKVEKTTLPEAPEKVEKGPHLPENENEEETGKEKSEEKEGYDVALFVPLAIDDVVTSDFKVGNQEKLPSATVDGLNFYEGALMAMDSLREQGVPIRLHVYDSRSKKEPLNGLLRKDNLDSADLIIGAVKGDDYKDIAAFAKEKDINFVSATYPNDGGVQNNPNLIIVNSTLRIHCTAIQSFAQQKFGKKDITVIYRNNAQGKQNLKYLREAYKKMNFNRKSPLNAFEWKEDTDIKKLISGLSKDKKNVIILTTLYADVSLNIIAQLNEYTEEYHISVVGMPTLNGLSELKKHEYAGIDIYYGTVFPYENLERYPAMKHIMWTYFNQYHARPGENALNGYETMFYFGHLLNKKGRDFDVRKNNSPGKLVTSFNFQPIYLNGDKKPDYFENTRIYFLRERDGEVTPAN